MLDILREIAAATGEELDVIRRRGFHLMAESAALPSEDVRLVVDCPCCGRSIAHPGKGRRGEIALAECLSCDLDFEVIESKIHLDEPPPSPRIAIDTENKDDARFVHRPEVQPGRPGPRQPAWQGTGAPTFSADDRVFYPSAMGRRRTKCGRVLQVLTLKGQPPFVFLKGDDGSRSFRFAWEVFPERESTPLRAS